MKDSIVGRHEERIVLDELYKSGMAGVLENIIFSL